MKKKEIITNDSGAENSELLDKNIKSEKTEKSDELQENEDEDSSDDLSENPKSSESNEVTNNSDPEKEVKQDKIKSENIQNTEPGSEGVTEILKNRLRIMNSSKVDELFENRNGEYFTSLNLAVLSEAGDKKNVIRHTRETTELLIKKIKTH